MKNEKPPEIDVSIEPKFTIVCHSPVVIYPSALQTIEHPIQDDGFRFLSSLNPWNNQNKKP